MDGSQFVPLIRKIYADAGFIQQVGELEFDAALGQMGRALAQAAAELVAAEERGVSMAEAVFDPEDCPHASRFHGMLRDLLFVPVPRELAGIVRQMAALAVPDDMHRLLQILADLTYRQENRFGRAMARFVMFELLCMSQRLRRLLQGQRLEAMTGAAQRVEGEAEAEIAAAEQHARYRQALLGLDRPVHVLVEAAGLAFHRNDLIDLLQATSNRLAETLLDAAPVLESLHLAIEAARERRRHVEEQVATLPLPDLVLLVNEAHGGRFTAEQLRRLHPMALGDLNDNTIHKRAQRIRNRLGGAVSGGPLRRHKRPETLADLLIAHLNHGSN